MKLSELKRIYKAVKRGAVPTYDTKGYPTLTIYNYDNKNHFDRFDFRVMVDHFEFGRDIRKSTQYKIEQAIADGDKYAILLDGYFVRSYKGKPSKTALKNIAWSKGNIEIEKLDVLYIA